MMRVMTRAITEKFWSWVLVSLAFFSAFVILARFKMCQMLGVSVFAVVPFTGELQGWSPQLFARIMHDLMHPACLFGYAVVLAWLALKFILRPSPRPSLAAPL